MTILTSNSDIDKIREAGSVIREIFDWVGSILKKGVTTSEIDKKVEEFIRQRGAMPAFKGYKGYPATVCASVDAVVVHGIPSEKIVLREGNIIGIDVGVEKNGFFADGARTYAVGKVSSEAQRLMDAAKAALDEGVKKAVAGNRISDISHAIQCATEEYGYKEVRAFVGHGIGRALHEAPEIPNWGEPSRGMLLKKGLVLAIEPMINCGTRDVDILDDGWTAVTRDGKLSAHFEDTVIVGENEAERIT